MTRVSFIVASVITLASGASPAPAQDSSRAALTAPDTLRLGDLLAAATSNDPRQRQLRLQEAATASRLRSLAAERLPSLAVDGQGQYQSVVTSIPISVPGVTVPTPPHDTYDAHLLAEQSLFDPTLAPRREIARARLAESQAQVRTTLFALRQEATDAFFAAAALQQRIAEVEAAIADLVVRQREVVIRYHEGAALRGDTAALTATLLQRRQDRLALSAQRRAALARLAELTDRPLSSAVTLATGDLAPATAAATRDLDSLRRRPEFEQFAAARERLAQQERLTAAAERPRVSAYGRLGYGRPGLNMLSSDFQRYWLAGVQLHWTPFRWGTTDREREELEIERDIVATNEAAFARSLRRAVEPVIASITQLDSTLALDDRVVALREQVVHEAQLQLREGVITAATYADKSTDLLTARLLRIQHGVELQQARATLLNTLGMEVR